MSKDFYQLLRSYGGISLEYIKIEEADFTATAGSAYSPPERGTFRRIAGSRQIQLLANAPGVVESLQTSSSGEVFLPANTVADNTNDAGNGRIFFFKNSGNSGTNILIKDYLGTSLFTVRDDQAVMVVGNEVNAWDFFDFSNVDVFPIKHITNGRPVDNQWLSYYNSITGNGSWIVIPYDCELDRFTWINRSTGVDFDLEFYKNGTASGDKFRTYSVRNSSTFFDYTKDLRDSLNEGDIIRVKYKDQGTVVIDFTVIYYFKRR